MSCSQVDKMPDNLIYECTGSASLYKEHNYIALKVTPGWINAQRRAGADLDRTPRTVFIGPDDFEEIWGYMKGIDFASIMKPKDEQLEATATDVNYTEHLKLVIDSQSVAEWSYPSKRLIKAVRQPLDSLMVLLGKKFDQRSREPYKPNEFLLALSRKGPGIDEAVQLTVAIDTTFLMRSGEKGRATISPEQFKLLLQRIQESKVLNRSYGSLEPGTPVALPDDTICSLRAEVERKVVLQFSYPGNFEGKKYFDQLWGEMDDLAPK
jgi:hypothetical protein